MRRPSTGHARGRGTRLRWPGQLTEGECENETVQVTRGHVTQALINAVSFFEGITGQVNDYWIVQRHAKFVFRKTTDQNTWDELRTFSSTTKFYPKSAHLSPPTCCCLDQASTFSPLGLCFHFTSHNPFSIQQLE